METLLIVGIGAAVVALGLTQLWLLPRVGEVARRRREARRRRDG
ncbi:hypothetical protein [Blastococcus sp. TF02-8]|nr:hypothetical protein [Blastococcus sp. TF02-8]